MIETLEHPHLAPYALLVPLDFLLRNGLQRDLARDVSRHRLGEGLHVAAKESGVAGRDLDVAEGEGEDELAGWRSAGVHCSGGTCHVARCHMRWP